MTAGGSEWACCYEERFFCPVKASARRMMRAGMQHRHLGELNAYAAAPSETSTIDRKGNGYETYNMYLCGAVHVAQLRSWAQEKEHDEHIHNIEAFCSSSSAPCTGVGRSMKAFTCLLTCVGLFAFFSSVTAEVEPIEIKGSHFFYRTVLPFLYEPFGYELSNFNPPPDPLGSGILCRRDIPYLSGFNINVIVVAYIDRDKDHSECVNALADAGIYVVPQVDAGVNSYFSLANYSNVLAFRMTAAGQQPTDLLYFRAAFRDMRTYMSEVLHRSIPIVLSILPEEQEKDTIDYIWCHDDAADIVQLPEHVDAVDFAKSLSGLIVLEGMRCDLYIGEFDDRNYEFMYDVYSDKGVAALSGGILDTYYGDWNESMTFAIMVLRFEPNNENAIEPLAGAMSLSSVLAAAKPSFTNEAQYNPTTITRSCPTGSEWAFSGVLPPRAYEPLCSCMLNTLQCTAKLGAVETLSDSMMYMTLLDACGPDREKDCGAIVTNSTTGKYGAYRSSMCDRTTVYSWVANHYWQTGGKCDLNGTAELRDAQQMPQGDCKFLLDQVGAAGEKTLTAFLGANTASSTAPHPVARTKLTAS
ncbi:1,3-beta-glucanosyltransferase [Paraphaeosphaeria sporulosa]